MTTPLDELLEQLISLGLPRLEAVGENTTREPTAAEKDSGWWMLSDFEGTKTLSIHHYSRWVCSMKVDTNGQLGPVIVWIVLPGEAQPVTLLEFLSWLAGGLELITDLALDQLLQLRAATMEE